MVGKLTQKINESDSATESNLLTIIEHDSQCSSTAKFSTHSMPTRILSTRTKRAAMPLALITFLSLCTSSSCGFQNPPIQHSIKKLHLSRTCRHAAFGANERLSVSTTIDYTDTPNNNLAKETTQISNVARRRRRDELASQRLTANKVEDRARDLLDRFFILLALAPPAIAFMSWGFISEGLSEIIDSFYVGRSVDGGQFAANLLRPTITGVVVPVISIALATLVSTTINVLRERQVQLRARVNKEACELRLLRRAVFGMFGTRQHAGRRATAMQLILEYVEQLKKESSAGAVDSIRELELSGGIAMNELDRLSSMLHGVDGAAASRQGSVSAAEDLILSLNGHRSDRVALLLSVFPFVHWGVLISLSLSVCLLFLIVSNQEVLMYLNSVQLRAMFAILVGVCSGVATICLDLADPFRGSFSVAEASIQLEDLRACLEDDAKEASSEAEETYSSARNYIQSLLSGISHSTISSEVIESDNYYIEPSTSLKPGREVGRRKWEASSPSRYGLVSTVYFHLLTGPLGSHVRIIGDVIVWFTTFIFTRYRSLSRRIQDLFKWMWRRQKESAESRELSLQTSKI